jgi:hypothetical protein
MFSMSSGAMSAMRFAIWSWLELMPLPALVIEFRPVAIAALLMSTPSTT